MAYEQVLVGTDGSSTANRAVTAASRIAAALSVPLVVATAWNRRQPDPPALSEEPSVPGGGGGATSSEAEWATNTTTDAAAIARREGVTEIRQVQPIGGPAESLLRLADEYPNALLVVGTYGLTKRAERLVGNVPHSLTHHCPIDLLLTTAGDDPKWLSAAIATDGSATAARAVVRGLEFVAPLGASATLVAVARDEERGNAVLEHVAAEVPGADDVDRRVAVGNDVAKTLADATVDDDLLVIGNKGMSGPSRLLGSVANRVTHHVPTDLLLVNTTR
jgi:nucleotide-binding universal stress UspA family protein